MDMLLKNGYFKGTPFHNSTSNEVQSGFWYGWGDFIIPDVYSSMHEELKAIRQTAAIIDMSPLPKMSISGLDATKLLDKLMTRNISSLSVQRCIYSPWCNEQGLMIGDGLIFRLSSDSYLVVGENSTSWFQSNVNDMCVQVLDKTSEYGVLSIQGPRSSEILSAVIGDDWEELNFSGVAFHKIAGVDVFIARQGFTGERGYEIWTPSIGGNSVRLKLLQVGKKFGALPAGEYAVDIARIEAGLILVSADYTGAGPDEKTANVAVNQKLTISPIEAGLGKLIEYESERNFIGQSSLIKSKDIKDQNCFLGLIINIEDIVRISLLAKRPDEMLSRVYWGSTKIYYEDSIVGRASSICWSPTLNNAVAFCFVNQLTINVGDNVQVELLSTDGTLIGLAAARVVDLPFIKIKRSET
jgi:aminomethyltransferase|tara:strand:- start:5270 stop:6505 length:1236 start_codon:yes stop_codon:yes gene_type:complete